MTPFKHNLTAKNPEGIYAVIALMGHLLVYVTEATDLDPAKRNIDAAPLLDKIAATLKEMQTLIAERQRMIGGN